MGCEGQLFVSTVTWAVEGGEAEPPEESIEPLCQGLGTINNFTAYGLLHMHQKNVA
jgi:hypothetical protein